jgi:hypothetical protein
MPLNTLVCILDLHGKCEKLYGDLPPRSATAMTPAAIRSISIPDMATLAYASRKGRKVKGSGIGIAKLERYDYVAAK